MHASMFVCQNLWFPPKPIAFSMSKISCSLELAFSLSCNRDIVCVLPTLLRKEGGEWLSETAMRDVKHFAETRIRAIKRKCLQEGFWKFDRYEARISKYVVLAS